MSVYRISEAAEKAGFSPSALRFYEASGLVPLADRTPAGYRTYDDMAVERLRFVHRARTLGLPLDEIGELVAIWDAGSCAPVQHDLAGHVSARREQVDQRVTELQALSRQLRDAEVAVLAGPGDGSCGADCACLAGPDVASPAEELRRTQGQADLVLTPSPREQVIACTLEPDQVPARLQAWQELAAAALTREPLAHGQRLGFTPAPGLAGRLAELCALEQGCCTFFTFTITLLAQRVTLDVTAPDGAAQLVTDLLQGQP